MTESPRQMTPSQSKIKQSTLEIKADLSSKEALRAGGSRGEEGNYLVQKNSLGEIRGEGGKVVEEK
jgi:hypothetical protein